MIKKVLYYTQFDISTPDGPGTNEFEFSSELAKRFGKNAWCVLPKPKNHVAHLDDMNVIHFETIPFRQFPKLILREWKLARTIADLVKSNSIDIITLRLPELPLVPWLLLKIHNIPVSIKTLGEWWHDGTIDSWKGKLIRPLVDRMQRSVLNSAFAIDCGLENLFSKAKKEFKEGERFVLLPNAANTDRFSPDSKPSEVLPDLSNNFPVLGFIGSKPFHRGAMEMVQAAGRLKREFPNITVLVAGEDEYSEILAEEVKKTGLKSCHFLGWVPYEHAPDTVNAMDIGISFFEPWLIADVGNASQKVRQYMACGKPVISIKQGHKFIDEHELGSTVDPSNPDEIDDAIRFWAQNIKVNKKEIQRRIRSYAVENLSTEKLFSDRLKFWEERLGN